MPTFVVELEATPTEHSDYAVQATGAHANIYVLAENSAEALNRAKMEVTDAGWNVTLVERVSLATADSFEEGNKGLEYYDQCQIDGVVIVLHSWRDEH